MNSNEAENIGREESHEKTYQQYQEIIPTLAHVKGGANEDLVKYQGMWVPLPTIKDLILCQQHFQAQPTDIILATFPKVGTTWYKSLMFSIANRTRFDFSAHPLLTHNPHVCVPFVELWFTQSKSYRASYSNLINNSDQCPISLPRLLSIHSQYHVLPKSLKTTNGCRFVYVVRNPKDVFISKWYFSQQINPKKGPSLQLEEAFDLFCKGISSYGPFWDHALGYLNASIESPNKILFMTYEDMKKEPVIGVRKLAEFMGQPFSVQEERDGVIEQVLKLCSFENMRNLEVNKTSVTQFIPEFGVKNDAFFRKGEVGDWKTHLTTEMIERIDGITEQKFGGTVLMEYISK